jgi:hypothetical protein
MRDGPVLLHPHVPKTAETSFAEVIYEQYNNSTGARQEAGMFCEGVTTIQVNPDLLPARWGGPWPWTFRGNRSCRAVQSSNIIRAVSRSDLRAVVGRFAFGLQTHINRPTTYGTMFSSPPRSDRIAVLPPQKVASLRSDRAMARACGIQAAAARSIARPLYPRVSPPRAC